MSFHYRIAAVEAKDRADLQELINSGLDMGERVVSASFETREVGPENWKTTMTRATLLIEKPEPQVPPEHLDAYGTWGHPR